MCHMSRKWKYRLLGPSYMRCDNMSNLNSEQAEKIFHIGGRLEPSSCPTRLVTCQYFDTQRSMQLFSPIFNSDSLCLFSIHFVKHVWVSLLNKSTLYSISFSASPKICSFSRAEGALLAAIEIWRNWKINQKKYPEMRSNPKKLQRIWSKKCEWEA